MNREEAIYFANCLKNNYTVDLNDMEAFCDMAIKALAQESTTKNYLSEEDILELKHRYGDEVGFVVRDMLTGEGKRWDKLPSIKLTTNKELSVPEVTALAEWTTKLTEANKSAYSQGYADGMKAQEPTMKALGEELRKARKGIADEKVLIGYNMAVAICNKHLGESEVDNGNVDN